MKRLVKAGCVLFILLFCAAMALAAAFLAPTNWIDNRLPAKQADMTAITLEWARLAPYPDNITDFTVQTEGGMFTRAFRTTFTASPEAIRAWLAASPGVQEATVAPTADGRERYTITPFEAQVAYVSVDLQLGAVEIYVAWS